MHKFEKEKKWPGDDPEYTVSSQGLDIAVGVLEPDPVFSTPSKMQADSDGGSTAAESQGKAEVEWREFQKEQEGWPA